MKNLSRTGLLALGAAALLVAGPADAQPTKASLKCASTKLKIYSKDVASLLKCYEKAVKKGDAGGSRVPDQGHHQDLGCLRQGRAQGRVPDGRQHRPHR